MAQKKSIHSLDALVELGVLPAATPDLHKVEDVFSVIVSEEMVAAINPSDPADPIAAQFVPSVKELVTLPTELCSYPSGRHQHDCVKGLIHRYPDRVLLHLVNTCFVHCRYCTRCELEGILTPDEIENVLAYIRNHTEIWEVILSGGDPLTLSDRRLGELIARINEIEHVKVLRIHTRALTAEPSRITPELIQVLRGRIPVYILLHCNHARELTPAARAACARLADAGIPLLSQSVLLRGVNDTVESLSALMRAFIESRVMPHYLHQMAPGRGMSHFRVPIAEGQALLRELHAKASGMCQPFYIVTVPPSLRKVTVNPVFVEKTDEGWLVEDFDGCKHIYDEGGFPD